MARAHRLYLAGNLCVLLLICANPQIAHPAYITSRKVEVVQKKSKKVEILINACLLTSINNISLIFCKYSQYAKHTCTLPWATI